MAVPFVWFALAVSVSGPFWSGGAIDVVVEVDGLMSIGSPGLIESFAGAVEERSGIVLAFAERSPTGGAWNGFRKGGSSMRFMIREEAEIARPKTGSEMCV